MTEKENMLAGRLYYGLGIDPELTKEHDQTRELVRLYNQSPATAHEHRRNILTELLGSIGEDVYIEPSFRCEYGSNIHLGNHVFINSDCVILDVCDVNIGDYVFIAPQTGIYTAYHPTDWEVRNTYLECGSPINIGNNVWIGGHCVINPGVAIGDGTVIGSGSVVTHNIPSRVIAAGNPCEVLRTITKEETSFWKQKQEEHDRLMRGA